MTGAVGWGVERVLPLVILVAIWELCSRAGLVSPEMLPAASDVLAAWWRMAATGELWPHVAASMFRAGMGALIAVALGTVLGVGMAAWRPLRLLAQPPLEALYPIPKSALIPVTAVWLGFGDASKILLVVLGCILPVTLGAFNGARGADQALVWSARSMGAGRLRTTLDVVLPSALPELFTGIRTALALAFILVVSSELIASREGFGYLIGYLGASGLYDAMFAVVATVAAIGFAVDRAFLLVEQRALGWRHL